MTDSGLDRGPNDGQFPRSSIFFGKCTSPTDGCDTRSAMTFDTHVGPLSLQERYSPKGHCFGCGPANRDGLHIRSFPSPTDPELVVADWTPEPRYEAFDGVLNGGIVGTLLDCHSNWTATSHLMRVRGADRPPTTVTLEYSIRMRRPTPSTGPIHLTARVVEASEDRATVDASIEADGVVTASCRGTFVAVKPGHPAYDRW